MQYRKFEIDIIRAENGYVLIIESDLGGSLSSHRERHIFKEYKGVMKKAIEALKEASVPGIK